MACWLCLLAAASPCARPQAPTPTPFLNLRESNLGYHGPAADFTNLTELKIGWFGPTNTDDPLHGDLWFAANLAVREANEQRSQGKIQNSKFKIRTPSFGLRPSDFGLRTSSFGLRPPPLPAPPFRLVARWAVDPWGTGVSQLTRMVYEEQPLALLGSVDSASTHLAEQVVAKANLPLVSPVATDGTATLAGVPWMLACAPSDRAVAQALVEAVLDELAGAGGRVALVTTTDHASRMTAAAVRQEFSRRGRLPDFRFDVAPGTTDLTRQTDALAEARPAAILILAGPEDAARLVVAARGAAPHAAVFGGPEMGRRRFRELAGAAAEAVGFPELVRPDPANPEWIAFRTRFLAEQGHSPDHAAVLTYDATRLLLEAIRRAGPSRARIREMLLALSPWPGIGGEIRFDGTGQNSRAGLPLNRPVPVERGCGRATPYRTRTRLGSSLAPPGSWPVSRSARNKELSMNTPFTP